MKDKLEEFIIDNREAFDIYEPNPRLWNKVRDNLTPPTQVSLRPWIAHTRRLAAVGLVLLGLLAAGFFGRRYQHAQLAKQSPAIPELREAEVYYTSMYTDKLHDARAVFAKFPEVAAEFNGEISLLDSITSSLKADLKDDAANADVVQALIENYRMRLTILERLLDELRAAEQPKTMNHEYDI